MGYTCMLLCGLFCATFRAADRGCQPAPGLPCALLAQEGGATKQSSGDIGRENAKVCLRIEVRAIYNRHPEVRAARRIAPWSKPRRATARLHRGRASFEAPHGTLCVPCLAPPATMASPLRRGDGDGVALIGATKSVEPHLRPPIRLNPIRRRRHYPPAE